MKILHIITSLELGGAEKLLTELLPAQQSMGIEVELLVLTDYKAVFLDTLKERGIKVSVSKYNSIKSPLNALEIMTFIRSGNFDIVHSHLTHSQYWTSLSRLLTLDKKRIYITSEHSTFNRRRGNPVLKFLDKIVYSQYDNITSISEPTRKALLEWIGESFENKTSIIINGIDINSIREADPFDRNKLGFDAQDIILTMAARFNFSKDHETVVKALALLPEKYKLIFVGDGQTRAGVENLVDSLNLKDRVLFTGTRNDVPAIFKMSDAVIHFSHFEGFGLSSVEAMASGVPLIASDIPGLREVVENGAILSPKGDAEKLAENIKKLKDPALHKFWIEKGLEISRQYDIGKSAHEYLKLYQTLSKEKEKK